MKKAFYLFLIAILFFLTGFLSFNTIEEFILSYFRAYQLAYVGMITPFLDSLYFGAICSIVPIVFYFIWRKTKTEENQLKLVSILIFIILLPLSGIISYYSLINQLESEKVILSNGQVAAFTSTVESMNIPLHIFIAVVLGFIAVFFFFFSKESNLRKRVIGFLGFFEN